jgi:hypothetical protein
MIRVKRYDMLSFSAVEHLCDPEFVLHEQVIETHVKAPAKTEKHKA